MAKANKDGWIRHRGGKCPVDAGTLVDVRFRNGLKLDSHFLTAHKKAGPRSLENAWSHRGDDYDIMAYRIHKTVGQVKGTSCMTDLLQNEKQPVGVVMIAGPIQWRDRIRQIDAEETERNAEHRQAIESLEEERLSLVQKLEAEGFKLIEVKPACDGMPAEDMSDPANWLPGDLIKFVRDVKDSCFTTGKQYEFVELNGYGSCAIKEDDEGDENGWAVEYFKWHSRP